MSVRERSFSRFLDTIEAIEKKYSSLDDDEEVDLISLTSRRRRDEQNVEESDSSNVTDESSDIYYDLNSRGSASFHRLTRKEKDEQLLDVVMNAIENFYSYHKRNAQDSQDQVRSPVAKRQRPSSQDSQDQVRSPVANRQRPSSTSADLCLREDSLLNTPLTPRRKNRVEELKAMDGRLIRTPNQEKLHRTYGQAREAMSKLIIQYKLSSPMSSEEHRTPDANHYSPKRKPRSLSFGSSPVMPCLSPPKPARNSLEISRIGPFSRLEDSKVVKPKDYWYESMRTPPKRPREEELFRDKMYMSSYSPKTRAQRQRYHLECGSYVSPFAKGRDQGKGFGDVYRKSYRDYDPDDGASHLLRSADDLVEKRKHDYFERFKK